VAVCKGQWFLADVAENKVIVGHGYTKLSYAAIKGANYFAWADKPDIMVILVSSSPRSKWCPATIGATLA
jgi:hypothetical protein